MSASVGRLPILPGGWLLALLHVRQPIMAGGWFLSASVGRLPILPGDQQGNG